MPILDRNINISTLLGDWLALFLVTSIGFFSHNQSFQLWRFLATAIPLCLSWLFCSPWFGLLSSEQSSLRNIWWKVIWAVILSTPLALLVRAFLLGSSVQVSFTLVMIFTSAVALIIWRMILMVIPSKK